MGQRSAGHCCVVVQVSTLLCPIHTGSARFLAPLVKLWLLEEAGKVWGIV